MNQKYHALETGANQIGTLNQIEKNNEIKRHSASIANFLAQQANNVLAVRHGGAHMQGAFEDGPLETVSSKHSRYKSLSHRKPPSEKVTDDKRVTARSLASVP